jgi:hypothetical protein
MKQKKIFLLVLGILSQDDFGGVWRFWVFLGRASNLIFAVRQIVNV